MKSVLLTLAGLIVTVTLLTVLPASAQEATMTDEHIARIKSNCRTALGTLARIHANDAPLYINRNQTYFSIGDKLMARLNSRLALNRYNAAELVQTASDYNAALARFRTAYKQYDDTMADLLKIDCLRQPVSFYDKVAEAREDRQRVNDSLKDLKTYIDNYRSGVQTFKTLHFSQGGGGQT